MTSLASLGDEVKIWDPLTFKLTEEFYSSVDGVRDLCWNHDGTMLASSCKNTNSVFVRSMNTGYKSTITHSFQLPQASCSCVDFASKYLLAGCDDGALHILDLNSASFHKSYTHNTAPITAARWNWNDQNIAFGCQTGQIMLYNVITDKASSPFKSSSSQPITQLRYNPFRKSSLASTSEDGTVSFWDTNTRSLVHTFKGEHQAPATDLAFSPVNDQLMVSVGLDRRLVLYDVQGKKSLKTIVVDFPLTSLDMQDGSKVAVGTSRGKIFVYDLRKAGIPVVAIQEHKSSVKRLCYSRKGMLSSGLSQSQELITSAYSAEASANLNDSSNNYSSTHVSRTGRALPSFLQDDSSSYLSHTNDNSGNLMGMSPVIKGHSEFNSLTHRSSASNPTGPSLYSFLHNESSHLSHKSGANNTEEELTEWKDLLNVSMEHRNGQAASTSSSDKKVSSPQQKSASVASQSPGVNGPRLSPRTRILNGHSPNPAVDGVQSSHRSARTESTSTVKTTSPSDPAENFHSPFNSKKTRKEIKNSPQHHHHPSSLAAAASPSTSLPSPPHMHQMMQELKAEMQDLKAEVRATIKSELRQPQTCGKAMPGHSEGAQQVVTPQNFQEEYLRRLIREELEDVRDKSHQEFLLLVMEMNKLHVDMWWWLDHRFAEQLHNPTLIDRIQDLTEEVKQLRCWKRWM